MPVAVSLVLREVGSLAEGLRVVEGSVPLVGRVL